MTLAPPVFVMGDVHGHLEATRRHLRAAGLIDAADAWTGADAHLWWVGDFVDRGPDGAAAVELAMRLEAEAARRGGRARAVIGNHDALLLAAARFVGRGAALPEISAAAARAAGSNGVDLERLDAAGRSWLATRPAMAREGTALIVHADALLYLRYGGTVADVNRAFAAILSGDDPAKWHALLASFSEHFAFLEEGAAAAFLRRFGGEVVVHGHTPIQNFAGRAGVALADPDRPLWYASGVCVNVDGGMYLGGAGFLAQLDRASTAEGSP